MFWAKAFCVSGLKREVGGRKGPVVLSLYALKGETAKGAVGHHLVIIVIFRNQNPINIESKVPAFGAQNRVVIRHLSGLGTELRSLENRGSHKC